MAAPGFDAAYPELDLEKYLNFDQVKTLNTAWCSRGTAVKLQTGTGRHVGGVTAVVPVTADYLAERFAGKPAPSTC